MNQIFLWFKPQCTFQCNHCNIGSTQTSKDILDIEQRKAIIDRLAKWPGTQWTINFVGGELFLNPLIIDLINYSNARGFKTTLTTNGGPITKDLVPSICESGLSYLSFSLDSVNPNTHDEIKGKAGCHTHLLSIVESFLTRNDRPKIYLNTLIQKQNTEDLIDLINLCIQKSIDGISFQPIAPPALFSPNEGQTLINKIKLTLKLPLTWNESAKLLPTSSTITTVLQKIIALKKAGAPVINSNQDLHDFLLYFSSPEKYYKKKTCTACDSISVMPDGSLKLCPSGKTLGNIFKDDIHKCYSSNLSKNEMNKIRNCDHPCLVLSLFKDDYYF